MTPGHYRCFHYPWNCAKPKYRYKRRCKGLNLKKSLLHRARDFDAFMRLFFISIDLLVARCDVTSSLQVKTTRYVCKLNIFYKQSKIQIYQPLLTANKTKNSKRNSQLILLLICDRSDGKAATDSPRHPSFISPSVHLLMNCFGPLYILLKPAQ